MDHDLDDLTFRATTSIRSKHPDIDSIAVHHARHFSFREKYIFTTIIGDDKPKSISVSLDCS
jgi:hypothetical protein